MASIRNSRPPCVGERTRGTVLLFTAADPVARARLGDVARIFDAHGDGVKAGFTLIVGIVSDQILAADFLADALYRIFKPPLLDEGELRAPGALCKDFRGAVDEDAFGVLVYFL